MNTAAPQPVQDIGDQSRHSSSVIRHSDADFYSASDIALATGLNTKRVKRIAQRESWPTRFDGYKLLFQPPARIADIIVGRPAADAAPEVPAVKFADLSHSDSARETVLQRQRAVQLFNDQKHLGVEVALQTTVAVMRATYPTFACSTRSLRRWIADHAAQGIDGLVDQKRGRVGRKAYVNDLQESEILKLAADAVEHGNWKRNNATARINRAAAFRELVANPTVAGPARSWLHGDRASKSSVPPSVRRAIDQRVSPLAATLVQIGPKALKLDGASVDCTYDNVRAGDAFTADDMTANVYVWVEWPNEQGFLLIRPQILAAADIGSMSWLNVRAIVRSKGQYTKDDVWGLIGDVFDDFGLFKIAVLEGGTWQSNVVVGEKTNITDEERFGGLRSLGVKLIHTRTPRGKIIETMFNQLQHAADNVRGFCGRDERKDCPEETKKNLAAVRAGHAHPRQFFLHLSEYSAHLNAVMNQLNNERGDGKILRGLCPADKWTQDVALAPRQQIPDSAKWLYRAAFRRVSVTRNGVRITVGSGRYMTAYNYFAPDLEVHRGRRVIVFWNDYDPDTDAVVYSIKSGRPDKLICVAPRVPDAPRFGANQEQMAAASTHKKLQAQLARTQRASLAPYLQRGFKTEAAQRQADVIDYQLRSAKAEQARRIRTRKTLRDFRGAADELLDTADQESPMNGLGAGDAQLQGQGRGLASHHPISPAEAAAHDAQANPRVSLDEAVAGGSELTERISADLSADALLD